MTPQTIFALALRIGSVYLTLYGFFQLVGATMAHSHLPRGANVPADMLTTLPVLSIVAGVVLFFGADRLAAFSYRAADGEEDGTPSVNERAPKRRLRNRRRRPRS